MTSQKLILLVDDIPDHVRTYEATLAEHGFRVIKAQTGKDALRLAHENLPECVVIDLRLPDMSGWDLCRRLKKKPQVQPRIIVLTPDVSQMCAADSAKAGCHAWLAHPAAAEDLARIVRQVLNLESDGPLSEAEALIGLTQCPACASDQVRATLRVDVVQYYCCKACGFCWRVETLTKKRRERVIF